MSEPIIIEKDRIYVVLEGHSSGVFRTGQRVRARYPVRESGLHGAWRFEAAHPRGKGIGTLLPSEVRFE